MSRSLWPVLTAVCLGLTACVAPAWDDAAYRDDATKAVQSALSQTRTALMVVNRTLDGDATRAYADVVISASEDAFGPIQDSFDSVQPPNRAEDALRDRVDALLSGATDAVARARLALRRGDTGGLTAARADLTHAAGRLQHEQQELQP